MKFGIIKERKKPIDKRVPLSPSQCAALKITYPDLEIVVESSDIRAFTDEEYQAQGIQVVHNVSECEVLLGVKEVPIEHLIPHKTYLFFSHTYKKQSYNRRLLQEILQRKIRLIDYEVLKDSRGFRILGFGRYAGIVGAYNALRAWGDLHGEYKLKPAHLCHDRKEMEGELSKVKLPSGTRLAVTGSGRVAGGVEEILMKLGARKISPEAYLSTDTEKVVYTQLEVTDYFKRADDSTFIDQDFYQDPTGYQSNFMPYAKRTDIYISAHFWSDKSPFIFTREDARSSEFNITLVSDISCDIDGPIASTLRSSTIADPFYGYDPAAEREVDFGKEGSIGVSAVDNLPCELPRDASEDFGKELINKVIPHFFNGDPEQILARASETTLGGELSTHFSYLQNYVDGIDD